jgi:hypothetical protein
MSAALSLASSTLEWLRPGFSLSLLIVLVLVIDSSNLVGMGEAKKARLRGRDDRNARGWCARVLAVMLMFFSSAAGLPAQTNEPAGEPIPPLVPPRSEIPPTFWEQNRKWILVTGVVSLGVVSGAAWALSRPKRRAPLPPAIQATRTLEGLRQEPETGLVLSRISQVLRRYMLDAFSLTAGELTTTEFSQLIENHPGIGREVASPITEFLRLCDLRKFAPGIPQSPIGAVARALELIRMAEARREALLQNAVSTGQRSPGTSGA